MGLTTATTHPPTYRYVNYRSCPDFKAEVFTGPSPKQQHQSTSWRHVRPWI